MEAWPVVVISDRAKKRLKSKHPWIFSNEIEEKPQAKPGDPVTVRDREGNFVASGYYNPHTLIAVRILTFHGPFHLAERLEQALRLREPVCSDGICRLVYGESDGLPGLIVDRYGDTLVAQFLTAGMERMREQVIGELIRLVQPKRILLRNDSSYRPLEGLPAEIHWIYGQPLEQETLEMDGLKFVIRYTTGQKTGFFLDQRDNRRQIARYAGGESMLDAFCYTGSWALYAAKAGFKRITAVDSSQEALMSAVENARLNNFEIRTVESDVAEFLRKKYSTPERYDLIVLDPPAFCKSKKHLDQALKGYREINLRAMKLLNKGGVLITCSCSQPLTPDLFEDILRKAAADSGRAFQLSEMRFQPSDHPVLLHFPESHYLKCAILRLIG
jgi:23S rRNA (cytosine1962-C5)-methyltransferase